MFEMFAKKAAYEADDHTQVNEDGSMTITPPHITKIGGQEFQAGDSKGLDAWSAKAKTNNEMIATGNDGAHYPINSAQGKIELIKAELQVNHGLTPIEAQKAVDAVNSLKAKVPTKAVLFKGKAKVEPPEVKSQEAMAKAGKSKQFRGPQGAVPG